MEPLEVVIDNRLRMSLSRLKAIAGPDGVAAVKARFTHRNPDYHKKRALGHSTYGVPTTIKTWWSGGDELRLPRGAPGALRRVLREHGVAVVFRDHRVTLPEVDFEPSRMTLRWYQEAAVQKCQQRQQGIVRSPTGSGKTTAALALIARLRQPALVVMRNGDLLEQWKRRVVSELGIPAKEIGQLGRGKKKIGSRITLAMQQTLTHRTFDLDSIAGKFGHLVVDEAHQVASRTFLQAIDAFPARYRTAWTADERRNDNKEFVIYDQFGGVIYEVERDDLEEEGSIVPVIVRLVPSDFAGGWYADADPAERDFRKLIDQMVEDEDRTGLVIDTVLEALGSGFRPVIVFSRRVEFARELADVRLFANGIRSGLMVGGAAGRTRFAEDRDRVVSGDLDAVVGTVEAVGTGTDIPILRAGVMALPLGNNPKLFNQVRGRICRPFPGKDRGYLYYIWDREAFPDAPAKLHSWTKGSVEAWTGLAWVPANRAGEPSTR